MSFYEVLYAGIFALFSFDAVKKFTDHRITQIGRDLWRLLVQYLLEPGPVKFVNFLTQRTPNFSSQLVPTFDDPTLENKSPRMKLFQHVSFASCPVPYSWTHSRKAMSFLNHGAQNSIPDLVLEVLHTDEGWFHSTSWIHPKLLLSFFAAGTLLLIHAQFCQDPQTLGAFSVLAMLLWKYSTTLLNHMQDFAFSFFEHCKIPVSPDPWYYCLQTCWVCSCPLCELPIDPNCSSAMNA